MHRPLNHLTRTGRASLALTAGLMAFTASASEQVDFSQPTEKTASSLAPIQPQDRDNEFKNIFRSESKGSSSSGVALPPSYSPQQNSVVIDAKTRTRLLQEWDRKKNWLLNGSNKQLESGKEKGEEDPFEEAVNSRRTALEKQFFRDESDGKKDRRKTIDRKKGEDDTDDSSTTPDGFSDDKMQSSTGSRTDSEKGSSDKESSRAYFSDPFARAKPAKKSDGLFGSGRRDSEQDKDTDSEAESQAAIAARAAARIGQIFSAPGAVVGPPAPTAFSSVTEPMGQRSTHQDDLRNILGRDPGAFTSVAGVLGSFASSRPAAALAPAPVSSFSSQPAFIPAPQPKRPDVIMQPQPAILPRPVRDF